MIDVLFAESVGSNQVSRFVSGLADEYGPTEKLLLERLLGSPVIHAADPNQSPSEDILGNVRDTSPDLGAFEVEVGGGLLGDLDLDGDVDSEDVEICLQVMLDYEQDPEIWRRADLNRDGSVNALDLQSLVIAMQTG